ncbi:hypothetical protein ABV409_11935 [Flagellimonas sp. DF-77]|uniref:hypothetical protein n=1 Tax=Flagellimonas algarum TaxID=3230298 RepID=UPI0033973D29
MGFIDRIKRFLRKNDEFLAIVVGIISSLAVILKTIEASGFKKIDVNLLTDCLNLLVLGLALIFIKESKLNIHTNEIVKICSKFKITGTYLSEKLERTNRLIEQLTEAIRWFVIILIGFYCLQFFMDVSLDYNSFKGALNQNNSILQLFGTQGESELDAAKFLSIEVLTNATNLFSATFLFTAFFVLFSVTLEKDNKTFIKRVLPMALAIGISILSIAIIITGIPNLNLEKSSTIIRLLGGIYNGVAMALLFSRFIAMEYYFQHSKKNFERNFYYYGITIGLPLYIVVQPLYALFNLIELGEGTASMFKAIVFLITFWGKLVLLFFVFTMLNKKWIHSYILLTLIENDNLKKLSIELKDVEQLDLDNNNGNDGENKDVNDRQTTDKDPK